jgi:ppGpp synthetase/RelA/SpoT-type nucleotidyltranferase
MMAHNVPGTKEWAREQVAIFRQLRRSYERLATTLRQVLEGVAAKYDPLAIVQVRAKTIASFAEKVQRKSATHPDPVHDFTDLCGGRIIVHTADDVRAVSAFIEKHFEIDWENSLDVSQRLKPTEFGYRSVHYIVSFKPGVFPDNDVAVEVPASLFTMKNQRAEVQVRTILEHAWADTGHDLAYKGSFELPVAWSREFARLAAILEEADGAFSRILGGLRIYSTSYGAYMTEEELRREIDQLEFVLEQTPSDDRLAARIAKLALTRGDWGKVIALLTKDVAEQGRPPRPVPRSEDPAILRDLGVALCKKHKTTPRSPKYRRGQEYLEQSVAAAPDVDALCSLAGTWKGLDDDRARDLYRRAFELDPADPYPLQNYFECEIALTRDTTVLAGAAPAIGNALERCRAHVEVGVNLPWAYFSMGALHLLSGSPNEALAAYAKAVQLSTAAFMIDGALGSLARLSVVADRLPGHEWARRLLLLGLAARFPDEEHHAALASLTSASCPPMSGPVVILAGGCDASVEERMRTYRELLIDAFRDYRGTVLSGGTREGIAGLAGDLREAYPEAIVTVGYVPKLVPADATVDHDPGRYSHLCKTDGNGFSPFEPLQSWIDLVAAGMRPGEVKLLGVNGGVISSLEYRIALALGAVVGVIEGTGREAGKILTDGMWKGTERLVSLPEDPATVRAFVGSGGATLDPTTRESVARAAHEEYRHKKLTGVTTEDPSMAAWDKLDEGLKESNRRQADDIRDKLHRIGCTVKRSGGRKVKLITLTDQEVEMLAEAEHARWTVERLLAGWTLGESRDVAGKVSPHLVSWASLPDDVKEWDRRAVRAIPKLLAGAGYEVERSEASPA